MDYQTPNWDDLKSAEEEAQKQKALYRIFGAAADSMANVPSMGDLMMKRQAPKSTIGESMGAYADSIENPLEKQKKLLTAYRAAKDSEKADTEEKRIAARRDIQSPETLQSQEVHSKMFPLLANQIKSMSADQIDNYFKTEGFKEWAKGQNQLAELKAKKDIALAEIAAKKNSNNSNKIAFDNLPEENKKQIDKLSTQSATKADIKSHIDSALEILKSPQVSEDQKIAAGQSLLKTLNSTEGSDAVGTDEAKRLGSFLEYKIANFTKPGSFIGRDIDQFTDQVALTSAKLGQAMQRNTARIDELYGRPIAQVTPIDLSGMSKPQGRTGFIPDANAGVAQPTEADFKAAEWLKKNRNHPKAKEIEARLRQKGL